ncbi:hypothetical protein HPB47_020438 [Ixodes persulcatus]|uniref:Uncharacterized protein n=1 Tax=Ixodes persulcatus TaxID=34615 RepID=A0AC60QGC3_IXOPE|nr:hypothetical protein HPB47_020438 [Ixodes persulcatus]
MTVAVMRAEQLTHLMEELRRPAITKLLCGQQLLNPDNGSDWMPSKNSRICSDHFVNNEPSNIESHPGYIPTQFPLVYKKRNSDPDAQVRRFGRWRERAAGAATSCPPSLGPQQSGTTSPLPDEHNLDCSESPEHGLLPPCQAVELQEKCSVETQTDNFGAYCNSFSVYTCSLQGGEGCTQITHREVYDAEVQHKPQVSSRPSGPNERTSFFGGYESIRHSEDALRDICNAYGGRCSDTHVTVDSGFLNVVQPGDVILADKGFPGIKAGLKDTDAVLVMPPFLSGNGQFSEQEVQDTYNIAQPAIIKSYD